MVVLDQSLLGYSSDLEIQPLGVSIDYVYTMQIRNIIMSINCNRASVIAWLLYRWAIFCPLSSITILVRMYIHVCEVKRSMYAYMQAIVYRVGCMRV